MKPDNQPKTDKPDLKNDEIQWRSQQVTNKSRAIFTSKLFDHRTVPTKENILSGIGKWFMQNKDEGEIRSERLQAIATVILKELNLYGGAEDELISDNDAKTVMKWVMENVLGSSVEEYATKKKFLITPVRLTFTIGELRDSFKLKELVKNKRIILNKNNDAKKQKN